MAADSAGDESVAAGDIVTSTIDEAWLPDADVNKTLGAFQNLHGTDIAGGLHALPSLENIPQPQLASFYSLQERPTARELASRLAILSPPEAQNAAYRFPTEQAVSNNVNGMWQLISAKSYRAAVSLSSTLLSRSAESNPLRDAIREDAFKTIFEQTSLKRLMSIWYMRLSCLFLLRDCSNLHFELNSFGTFDDAFYFVDMHPALYGKKKRAVFAGTDNRELLSLSLVPFCMRLLQLQLPLAKFLQGNIVSGDENNAVKQHELRLAFEKLYDVKSKIDTLLTNVCTRNLYHNGRQLPTVLASDGKLHAAYKSRFATVWNQRQLAVLNTLLLLSWHTDNLATFYSTFRQILRTLCRLDTSGINVLLMELHLIRFCIRLGDITSATTLQLHADSLIERLSDSQKSDAGEERRLQETLNYHKFNKILILIARDEYAAAASALMPPNDDETRRNFAVSQSNAAAVAAFYQGQVAQATSTLEQTVFSGSATSASEIGDQISTTVLFNLSMLYELSGVNVYPRKLALLKYAALNIPEAVSVQGLKITPPPPATVAQQPPPQQLTTQQQLSAASGDYRPLPQHYVQQA